MSARILEITLNLKFARAIGLNLETESILEVLGINTIEFELKLLRSLPFCDKD